jgi:hypothetical protein
MFGAINNLSNLNSNIGSLAMICENLHSEHLQGLAYIEDFLMSFYKSTTVSKIGTNAFL